MRQKSKNSRAAIMFFKLVDLTRSEGQVERVIRAFAILGDVFIWKLTSPLFLARFKNSSWSMRCAKELKIMKSEKKFCSNCIET